MSEHTTAKQDPGKNFSPFAGCSIFIIAGLLAAGMIAFAAWTYFKVKDTITGFTADTPQPITLVDTTGKENEQVALKAKLVNFGHKIETKQDAGMTLNADELNLAIATFDILKPLRSHLTVTSISGGTINADIAFPIKAKMGSDEKRYLNATITIQPELVDGSVFPRITAVLPVNGGNVPEQFRQFISKTLLIPVREHKELGPLFHRISSVEIKGDTIALRTDPSYRPPNSPDGQTKQSVFERFMTGFAVIAVLFLAIVSVIIILSRRKAKS